MKTKDEKRYARKPRMKNAMRMIDKNRVVDDYRLRKKGGVYVVGWGREGVSRSFRVYFGISAARR